MRIDKPELRVRSVRFFCNEAWRLKHGQGLESGNWQEQDAGDRHHARKAAAERVAGGAIGIGRTMALAATLVLLALLVGLIWR